MGGALLGNLSGVWRVGGERVKSCDFPSVEEITAEGACDSFWCGCQETQLLNWN